MLKSILYLILLLLSFPMIAQKAEGQILTKSSKQAISDAWVVLFEIAESGTLIKIAEKECDSIGYYFFELEKDKHYKVVANAENYFANEVKYDSFKGDSFPVKNIYLYQGCEGMPSFNYRFLKAIYFQTQMYFLNEENQSSLDNLANLLKQYPNYTLLIEGHSDIAEAGENTYLLSEMRAKSVVKYLYDKGIDAERLFWIGYGDMQLDYIQENQVLNCRVEFKIQSANYVSAKKTISFPAPPPPTHSATIFHK